jgi:hypothetical protein
MFTAAHTQKYLGFSFLVFFPSFFLPLLIFPSYTSHPRNKSFIYFAFFFTSFACLWCTGTGSWIEHVARMGENRNAQWILMGKPEGKRPLAKCLRRWATSGFSKRTQLHGVGRDLGSSRQWHCCLYLQGRIASSTLMKVELSTRLHITSQKTLILKTSDFFFLPFYVPFSPCQFIPSLFLIF